MLDLLFFWNLEIVEGGESTSTSNKNFDEVLNIW